jgi:hypothetical protein
MALSAGTELGPYEVLASVGAGGMGEVYKAWDTRLDRTVAIKVLPSHLSANPEVRQRFDREARKISSLSHPHICALHDVGHQDGIDYLVMTSRVTWSWSPSRRKCLEGRPLPDDDPALRQFEAALDADRDPEPKYFSAARFAYCGNTVPALRILRASVEGNYLAVSAMDRDPLLAKVRNTTEFAEIRALVIEKQKQLAARRSGH